MIKEITPARIIDFINELIALDREAISGLFTHRLSCNEALANHPTVQVQQEGEGNNYSVSLIGILNGLIGADDNQIGYIAANFDVVCPNGCIVIENGLLDKECPECGSTLILGKLNKIEFLKKP
ncbi:MAG: hypothetical protein WC783_02875 [Candidatus Paceibacterota bacterium]|jgi:hypothetical protein